MVWHLVLSTSQCQSSWPCGHVKRGPPQSDAYLWMADNPPQLLGASWLFLPEKAAWPFYQACVIKKPMLLPLATYTCPGTKILLWQTWLTHVFGSGPGFQQFSKSYDGALHPNIQQQATVCKNETLMLKGKLLALHLICLNGNLTVCFLHRASWHHKLHKSLSTFSMFCTDLCKWQRLLSHARYS